MIFDAQNSATTKKTVIGAQSPPKTAKQLKLDARFSDDNLPGHASGSLANYLVNGRATVHSLLLVGVALVVVMLIGGGFIIHESITAIRDHPGDGAHLILFGLIILGTLVFGVVGLQVAGAIIILALAAEPSPILQAIASVVTLCWLFTIESNERPSSIATVWTTAPFFLLIVAKVLIGLTLLTSVIQLATRALRPHK